MEQRAAHHAEQHETHDGNEHAADPLQPRLLRVERRPDATGEHAEPGEHRGEPEHEHERRGNDLRSVVRVRRLAHDQPEVRRDERHDARRQERRDPRSEQRDEVSQHARAAAFAGREVTARSRR